MTHPRFCPECGLVDQLDGTDRCAECGLTVYDDSDALNRSEIAQAIALRRQLVQPRWTWPGAILIFFAGLVGGAALTRTRGVPDLVAYGGLVAWIVFASAMGRHRLSKQWHAAIDHFDVASGRRAMRRRVRTGIPVLSAVVLIGFVGVQHSIGIERLAYARGDSWLQIFPSALAHGGPVHLIGNVIALLSFGIVVDLRIGRFSTVVILVLAAIGGAVAQARYSPEPMVGFSAAICGLAGAQLALMPRRPTVLVLQGFAIPMPTWLWTFIWLGLLTLLAGVDSRAHVAWVAHLGGFIVGFYAALPMRWIRPSAAFELVERGRRERMERIATR